MKTLSSPFQALLSTLGLSLLLALTLVVSSVWAKTDIRHVTPTEAAQLLAEDPAIQILDVRTGWEYKRGHLEGAVNENYYSFSFKKNLHKLDKDVTWIVHCKTGVRSGKTLPIMEELGFKQVIHMDGGIDAWRAASLPEVK